MSDRLNRVIFMLKEDLGVILSIAFGMFLFILFFEPFAPEKFDRNNMLLFDAGFGVIVYLYIVLVRVGFHSFIQNFEQSNHEANLPYFFGGFIMIVLSSVTFAFYLRYVGSVNVSFFLMFKVIIICFVPPVILFLNDSRKELYQQNELLIQEKKLLQKEVEKLEDDYLNKSIEFVSENKNDNLTLVIANTVYIKSADNYVEIAYKEDEEYKKKLIRTTLKNIELQIRPYPNFIRCHRSCIVNFHYIEKLDKNYGNHWITLTGFHEQIPVSRQYLLRVKESI